MKLLKILPILIILIIIFLIGYLWSYNKSKNFKSKEDVEAKRQQVLIEGLEKNKNLLRILKASSTSNKIDAIKELKDISLDESADKSVRVEAGQAVVSSFFEYGAALAAGFSTSTVFDEREVYDYAKYISSLGDSPRNSLLTAYIGLRFFSEEIDRKFIQDQLSSYKRYVSKYGSEDVCGEGSKFSSVLYLAQKNKHTDVSEEYGSYFDSFERVYEMCPIDRKVMIGFMWVAAISDIGQSDKEEKKAKEIVFFITRSTAPSSRLVQNLRYSYFSQVQEPDTIEIVKRLVTKYPEFKIFIERLKDQYQTN